MLTFEKLQSLIAHATDPSQSMFYRGLYKLDASQHMHVNSLTDWQKLPFVTKELLIDTPLRDRSFLKVSHLDHLRTSSGTSGKPPLFSPRTHLRNMEYRLEYHDFAKAVLAFCVPAMPHWHEAFQAENGKTPQVIAYDPKEPAASVRLARFAGVDSISVFAFQIQSIGEHMLKEGISGDIRFIEICGEACSRALFDYIRTTFPNATLVPFYGSSEVEDSPMGVPCRAITGEEPLSLYHAKKSQYHELLDPVTGAILEPVEGAEGELVVTAYPGEPAGFPLIRYRTGDTARVVTAQCAEHSTWSFTLLGRTELDFVKLPGGVLNANEIERVLRLFSEEVTDRFTLHCYTKQTPQGPLFEPILEVEVKDGVSLDAFAEKVAGLIRVAPSFTYADGVKEKRYLPLCCIPMEKSAGGKKHLRIIRHQ